MTALDNEEIKHQIYFEQYKTGQANKIIALLDTANKRISEKLKQVKEVATKKRYKTLMQEISQITKALKEAIENGTDIEGVIDYELNKQIKLLKDIKIYNNMVFPNVEQIKTSALFSPITPNMTYQSYLESIETNLYNIWDSHIRTGYLTGQTTQSIIKDVLGSISANSKLADAGAIAMLRRSIYNNTRTVLQAFASETRDRIYKANEDFIDGYKFLSTLDTRTCLICSEYDGKVFKKLADIPKTPLHTNCRCTVVPYFEDGELDTGRASKDGYVDTNTTYADWLESQPEEIQKEVLGVTRYNLYKKGVQISTFIVNNKILTLEELKKKL